MTPISVVVEDLELVGELNDSSSGLAVAAALPLEGRASVWGEEVYFSIPVTLAEAADAQEEVPVGTLAYWPPGQAFCIFFGQTPVSRGKVPRAYSPVNILGRLEGDLTGLRQVRDGDQVRVTPRARPE